MWVLYRAYRVVLDWMSALHVHQNNFLYLEEHLPRMRRICCSNPGCDRFKTFQQSILSNRGLKGAQAFDRYAESCWKSNIRDKYIMFTVNPLLILGVFKKSWVPPRVRRMWQYSTATIRLTARCLWLWLRSSSLHWPQALAKSVWMLPTCKWTVLNFSHEFFSNLQLYLR